MTDVLGYLQSKALPLKPAGARNVHTACFFCSEDPTRRGRLYINVDSDADIAGLYFCHICEAKGNLVTLKRHFGDQVNEREIDSATRAQILTEAAAYYQDRLFDFREALDWLKGPERGLTVATIVKHEIGYAPMDFGDVAQEPARPNLLFRHLRQRFEARDILATGLCQETKDGRVIDALGGMVTIPYHVAGQVVAIRGRTWPFAPEDFATWTGRRYTPTAAKYKTCSGTSSRLFNTDACWGTAEVTCSEGELDALVLEQQGYAAVGVPGATAWQENWNDYFSAAKRVFIIFDRDAAGETAANKLVERLGAKARRINLSEPGTKCDPTQWFVRDGHTREEFETLLTQSRRGPLLVTVREAIDEFSRVQSQPGLKFGWELFDTLIDPGLQQGQLMMALARTGCLTADTEIVVDRGSKPQRMNLGTMHKRWHAKGRRSWDRSTPTRIQRADGEVVRFGEVEEIWHSGVRPIYRLTTHSGRSIKASPEHPFLTPSGWQQLGELTVLDDVYVDVGGTIGVERIVNMEFLGEQETYDISMKDEPHNFLANGFVVHNTGKTVFLLNLMQRMRMVVGQEHLRMLFVSLEQTRGEWWDRARRIHRFYNLRTEEEDAARFWEQNLMLVDRNRITEPQFTSILDDYEHEMGGAPDVVLLDYLGYFARGFRGESYQRTSDAVMTLKSIAKDRRIPMIVPHQVSRSGGADGQEFGEESARDSGLVSETADFLLTMWSPDNLLGREEEDKTGQIHVRIAKSRHGGRGRLLEMQFAPVSLVMVPNSDPLCERARREFNWKRDGDSWEKIVYRHRTGFDGHIADGPLAEEASWEM